MVSAVTNNPSNVHEILRAGLCISCRTTLQQAEPCDQCGAQNVVSLHQRTGRARAYAAAWTHANEARARSSALWPLLAFAACFTSALLTWWWSSSARTAGLVMLATAAIVIPIVYRLTRDSATEKIPRGATITPRCPEARVAVEGLATPLDPAGAQNPLGPLAIAHVFTGGSQDVLLRDAYTEGFIVTAASGEQFVVPRGRVRFESRGKSTKFADTPAIERLLVLCDPSRTIMADEDVFPFESVERLTLTAGARVRLALGQPTEVPWVEVLS